MSNIVVTGQKVDLHIHSCFSKTKDELSLVGDNTIENLNVLIKKLNEKEVNICAISDHDIFSFDLYSELKKQEGIGTIKKVLPAIEFSVVIGKKANEKQIHIITVFDDADEEKIKRINSFLVGDDGKPKYDKNCAFSEATFISIMGDIGLNVICIAHQKNSLTSEKKREHDANTLEDTTFNSFLCSEYFEAFEFKDKRNEVFNNISKRAMSDDLMRFITGSDCHKWSVYPKYDDNDKTAFSFTYLKCLPTFKGVALALTDDSRISLENNFFTLSNKVIKSFDITIDGVNKQIPLSKGINAIIGDNSIGKSLIVHKMTNYYRQTSGASLSPLTANVVAGYNKYLNDNKIVINTLISEDDLFGFDTQGEIRKKFSLGKLKDDDFFADKYPSDVNTTVISNNLNVFIDALCVAIQNRFSLCDDVKKLTTIKIPKSTSNATSLTLKQADTTELSETVKHNQDVISKIDESNIKLTELLALLKIDSDKESVQLMIDLLITMSKEYKSKKQISSRLFSLANCINTAFDDKQKLLDSIKSASDTEITNFTNSKDGFVGNIVKALVSSKLVTNKDLKVKTTKISPEELEYLGYVFVKKTAISKIDDEYISTLILSPFRKGTNFDINSVTKDVFVKALNGYDEPEDPVNFYKLKLKQKVNDDLKCKGTIILRDDDGEKEYSAGVNVKIYFDILSTQNNKEGIYIIDQPEDDVSPKAIKSFILSDLKRMSRHRQIILVTHNPQFVVNLDVDNVLYLTKDDDDQVIIQNGALEYESNDYKVLSIVANTLDGGIETIRKRWKKYDKTIKNN